MMPLCPNNQLKALFAITSTASWKQTQQKMIQLQVLATLLAASSIAVNAVEIVVQSVGGNKSSDMPYGLMHEVL